MKPASRFLIALAALALAGSAHGFAGPPVPTTDTAVAETDAQGSIRLAQIFRRREEAQAPPGDLQDPMAAPDLSVRLGRLENQIRQLTGLIEELQHRNQLLEQQLKRVQQDTEYRFQEMGPGGRPPAGRVQPSAPGVPGAAPPPARRSEVYDPPVPGGAPPPGRRTDVFDPATAPNAPGAPRTLGTLPAGSGGPDPGPVIMAPGSGEPARRPPGAPLDLGTLAGTRADEREGAAPGADPAPAGPPPGGRPVGPQAVLAPSGSAKDEYDLAYGAILRRDYELAEEGFRTFLAHHPRDRLVPEAHYWLGESYYQRQKYNDSAEAFLDIYNKYPNSLRAPDALLRLGQSLAAIGKQEAACASFGAVLTKYPKATANVKRSVEQEQKRARC